MSKITKFMAVFAVLVGCLVFVEAQNIVVGTYKGYKVKLKYYKGTPDDIESLEYGLVTELNKKVSKMENQIRELNKTVDDLRRQTGGKSPAEVMELRAQVWALEKKIKDLQDSVSEIVRPYEFALKGKTDTINGLVAYIQELEAQRKGGSGKTGDLKKQIAQLNKDLAAQQKKQAELDDRIEQLNKDLSLKQSKESELNEQIVQLNSELEVQRGKETELRNQIAQLEKNMGAQQKGKGDKTEELKNQIAQLNKELASKQSKETELSDQIAQLNRELETERQKETELRQEISVLREENNKLSAQIAETQSFPPKTDEPPTLPHMGDIVASGHHIGIQYRIGMPFVFNQLLAQTDGESRKIWTKNLTLSHQVGLFYGSPSLSDKVPFSLGAGLEYGRVSLAAGIGHLNDTVGNAVDADNDIYSAFLEYRNVVEKVTLHYVSVPLTLSFGRPRNDKVCGYGQIAIAPAFCVAHTLSSTGNYDCTGHYSQMSGCDVDFYLDDFSPLGFGSNLDVNKETKVADVSRFLLTGRLSAGLYMPLCSTRKQHTCQWVFKVGVNVDFSITTVAKEMASDSSMPDAIYRLSQYNLLSGHGCRIVNPGLEVGLVYIIKK